MRKFQCDNTYKVSKSTIGICMDYIIEFKLTELESSSENPISIKLYANSIDECIDIFHEIFINYISIYVYIYIYIILCNS